MFAGVVTFGTAHADVDMAALHRATASPFQDESNVSSILGPDIYASAANSAGGGLRRRTPDSSTVVGWLSLDPLPELRRRLGFEVSEQMDDLELVRRGYATLGSSLAEHLSGSFAFVVWDPGAQRLYAACDAWGTRSIFLDRTSTQIRFATSARPFADRQGFAASPDLAWLAEFIQGRITDDGRSAFAGVQRVRAGEWVLFDAVGGHSRRMFKPPQQSLATGSREDLVAAYRDVVSTSLDSRLAHTSSCGVEITGGMVSTSMLALAASTGRSIRTFGVAAGKLAVPDVLRESTQWPNVAANHLVTAPVTRHYEYFEEVAKAQGEPGEFDDAARCAWLQPAGRLGVRDLISGRSAGLLRPSSLPPDRSRSSATAKARRLAAALLAPRGQAASARTMAPSIVATSGRRDGVGRPGAARRLNRSLGLESALGHRYGVQVHRPLLDARLRPLVTEWTSAGFGSSRSLHANAFADLVRRPGWSEAKQEEGERRAKIVPSNERRTIPLPDTRHHEVIRHLLGGRDLDELAAEFRGLPMPKDFAQFSIEYYNTWSVMSWLSVWSL